jgi:hypothetical protein
MTISGDPNPSANSSSKDDDVEDDTYMTSLWARPHGKGLASASSTGATRDEEEDGGNGNDGAEGDEEEEDEEVFDVEEINPSSYIHMEIPVFRLPLNPD